MRKVNAPLCAFCLCSALWISPTTRANPLGGAVVGGDASATISGEGTALVTIKQNHSHAIVNWDSFSIAAGEMTKFIQPSATASILNRVTSANPSLLYGNLEANGRVFLINPAGVLVGRSGVVNTRGFLASTFDVGNDAFRSGSKLSFSGSSTASVRNEGTINALGGDVFMIADSVQNAGKIQASGTVGLAAGSGVLLAQAGSERIAIQAGNTAHAGQGTGVDNQGQIQATTAELKAAGGNIYALAINNGGVVRATTAVNEGGKIFLRASGGNVQNSGTLSADGSSGAGGKVIVSGGHNEANPSTVTSSGTISAASADGHGGTVQVLGDNVGLFDNARVDVSGSTGGGTALIGGDYRGQNPAVQNAQRTYVGANATINADAVTKGDGGKVIVWSDESTHFYGNITARGGAQGGNGGFAEVSGKNNLDFQGMADLSAAHGQKGTLLLDPKFIYVMNGGTNLATTWQTNAFADDPTGTNFLSPANLTAQLTNSDVILQANTDIIFSNNVTVAPDSGNGSLTLEAGRSILFSNLVSIALQPGGAFSATVNSANADAANRDPGRAVFWMASDASIRAPRGITVQAGTLASVSDGAGGTTNVGLAANTGNFTIANVVTTNLTVSSLGSVVLTNALVGQDANLAAGTNLDLSAVFVTNNLVASATFGSITGSGVVNVANTATLSAGQNITLANNANDFGGVVTANAGQDVNLVGANGLAVTGSSANLSAQALNGDLAFVGGYTAGNTLTASASQNILQTGPLSVGSTTTLSAGQNIALGNAANDFHGTVTVNNGQLVTLADANNLTVAGTSTRLDALALGGDLTFAGYHTTGPGPASLVGQASGNILQSGVLNVVGDSSFTAGAGRDILLGSFANSFEGGVNVSPAAGLLANVALRNVFVNAPSPTGLDQVANSLTLIYDNSSLQLPALNLANNLTVVAGGTIRQSGAFHVGGTTQLAATNSAGGGSPDILLAGFANSFTGPVLLRADGSAQLRDAGNLTVGNWGAGIGSDLTLIASGDIGQAGALTVGGNTFLGAGGNVTLNNANNDFIGLVTVTNGATVALTDQNSLSVKGIGGSTNLTVMALNGDLTLAGYTVANNLGATASRDILQSGAVTVGNATALSAGRNITLTDSGNDFVGLVTVGQGQDVSLRDANSLSVAGVAGNLSVQASGGNLTLAGNTVTNTLTALASQDILQSGAVSVGGATSLSAGRNIALNDNGNDFGGLVTVLSGQDVSLHDANGVAVTGTSSNLSLTTVSGDATLAGYTVTSNLNVNAGRDILQSGAVTVGNTTALSAGRNIALNDSGNDFGGLVTVSRGQDVSLSDANSLSVTGTSTNLSATALSGDVTLAGYTVANNLSANAGRDILQNGAVIVGNTTTLGAARNIALNNNANDFVGQVTVTEGQDVTLHDANGLTVSGTAGNLTVQAGNGDLILAGYTVTNNLSATASRDILQSGPVTVGNTTGLSAGRDIVLNDGGNDFVGQVNVAQGRDVTLRDANSLTVGGNSRNLTATAQNGDLTLAGYTTTAALAAAASRDILQSAAVDVGTTTSLSAGRNVVLNDSGNDFVGQVSVTQGQDVSLRDANSLTVSGTSSNLTAQALGGNLTLAGYTATHDLSATASQNVLQTGAVTVGNLATLTAQAGNVVLNNPANDFNVVQAHGQNVSLADRNALMVSNTVAGNDLTVSAVNDLSVVNAQAGRDANLSAGANLTLDGVTVGADLAATATSGNINGPGAISVGGATTLNAGNDITLANLGNDFVGQVTVQNGRNVTLADQNDLTVAGNSSSLVATGLVGNVTLAGYTTTGDLVATAGNSILVPQTLTVGGDTTLTADAISINAGVQAGSGLVILQPLSSGANITLSGASGGSYSGLNHVHAGVLRIGNADDFTGNITISGGITLGQHTSNNYDPGTSASQATGDDTTLSLWTHGGNITETGAGFLKVPRLSLQGGTVTLPNVHNDIYFLAGSVSSVFYVDANGLQIPPTSLFSGTIDGFSTLSGSRSLVQSAGQGEAADTERGFNIGVEVPMAKARISQVVLVPPDKAAYQKLVDEAIGGTDSIWMSYALHWIPERQLGQEDKYRIEANSKWVAGGFEFGGSTAGPQQGR